MNNRIARRFPIRVPVEYECNSATGRGTTADVSTSGVRIAQAVPPVVVGSGLTLRFSFFAGSFDTPFAANVVRQTSDGFAVQFGPLDPVQRKLLHQALPVRDET